mgnify:CR=1 FL=1
MPHAGGGPLMKTGIVWQRTQELRDALQRKQGMEPTGVTVPPGPYSPVAPFQQLPLPAEIGRGPMTQSAVLFMQTLLSVLWPLYAS